MLDGIVLPRRRGSRRTLAGVDLAGARKAVERAGADERASPGVALDAVVARSASSPSVGDVENARHVLGALHVAARASKRLAAVAAQHDVHSSLEHPAVLGAAALARIHHQRALPQRHAGQAAGHDADAVAPVSTNGRKSTWRGARPLVDEGRARSTAPASAGRCSSPGSAFSFGAKCLDLLCRRDAGRPACRSRPSRRPASPPAPADCRATYSSASGSRQRQVCTLFRIGSSPMIEAHDLRHVGVDRLVVGDAGAGRVGDARRCRRDRRRSARARRARNRAGRPADRGSRRRCGGRSRRRASAPRSCACRRCRRDEQIAPFDQLDAHLSARKLCS